MALHKAGKKLTVDIASWNGIWNWPAISASLVDHVFLMDTYTGTFSTFEERLEKAVAEINIDKLVCEISVSK